MHLIMNEQNSSSDWFTLCGQKIHCRKVTAPVIQQNTYCVQGIRVCLLLFLQNSQKQKPTLFSRCPHDGTIPFTMVNWGINKKPE